MEITVHTKDFPTARPFIVVPTNGSYSVLYERYRDFEEFREVCTTLPICRVAVIRGSLLEGYSIEHAPKGMGRYEVIAEIKFD